MNAIDAVISLSRYAPAVPLESKLLKSLKKIRPDASEAKYAGASLVLGMAACLIIAIFAFLINETIAFGLFGFAFGFGFCLALPSMELKAGTARFRQGFRSFCARSACCWT